MMTDTPKRQRVVHDEGPAIINDHAFVPRAQWWSLCKICSLAEAAHLETTIDSVEEMRKEQRKPEIAYYSDDNPDVFD